MSHECACTRPIHDTATVCPQCAFTLDNALAEIVEYLATELDVTLSKQARVAAGTGTTPQPDEPQAKTPGTLKPQRLPYHGGASNAASALKAVIVSWARLIIEGTGAEPPADDLAALAAWMRTRVGWLRYHEAGRDAVDEICSAVDAARHVVDRPADRLYAGRCDCGADLYARLDASYVTCRADSHEEPLVWPVEERRRWLLESAEDVLATTTEISRALTRYARPVTPSALRGYVARKRLVAKGERMLPGRKGPVPLYRLGDVLNIVAKQAERASA